MQSAQEKNIIVVKLDDGEDLFPSLERIVDEYGIVSGAFLGGVGMIREVELGYWNGTEYLTEVPETPHELLHYGGSIARVEGRPMFHIHATLAGPDHRTIGGHVNRATVAVLNEIFILKLEELELSRKLNPDSGLMELMVGDK